jgi:flagellar assembly protein FliH
MFRGIIAKEELVALQRWELPGIDEDLFIPPPPAPREGGSPPTTTAESPLPLESPPPTVTEAVAALPTVEELEAISRAAYEEGFERGQREGFEEGHRDGLAQGLEQGRRDGLAQGLEQGHREGRAGGEAEAHARIERLGQILTVLEQPLVDLDAEVEEQLVALALAVARQMVRRELHLNPGEIVPVVREALASLPAARRHLRLYLHPDDIHIVRAALGEGERGMRLIEDVGLTRGGCRVETDVSRIDATVEQRLNRVITSLLGGERESDRA